MSIRTVSIAAVAAFVALGCRHVARDPVVRSPMAVGVTEPAAAVVQPTTPPPILAGSEQLVVVTTSDWRATTGTLRRYERSSPSGGWTTIGSPVPVVVGRSGLAWGTPFDSLQPSGPVKREGDGAAPAGVFAVDTAFGFSPRELASWMHVPYFPIRTETECVDDAASVHYNTIVDRDRVAAVDWKSSEQMRRITQYRIGMTVRYNGPVPSRGRGSCIFLHIWSGPSSVTAGCTAMEESALVELLAWIDARRSPRLVQLPSAAYAAHRREWALP